MTCALLCQLVCCSQRQKQNIPNLILFEWRQFFLQKCKTGKENLTQASWNSLYFVTLWARQSVIGPLFLTILIFFRDWWHGPLTPLWLRHCTELKQDEGNADMLQEKRQHTANKETDRQIEQVNYTRLLGVTVLLSYFIWSFYNFTRYSN